MMKLADMGGVIWLIIIVMFAIGKGLSKLQQPGDKDDSSTADDAPPVVPSRPRILPPQPQPRPGVAPITRRVPRAVPRLDSPRSPTPTPRGQKVGADDIRRFVEQLSGKPQPQPPPVAPPPVRKAEVPPIPTPQPEPIAQTTEPAQTVTTAPMASQVSRASQWMEALRDRNSIRNIIISAEIIGPPIAER